MRVVGIVQARMGSTRLPGKVLRELAGRPMLAWVCERLSCSRLLDGVGVATTVLPADDAIDALCRARGWQVHRGSELDVLGRFRDAASKWDADVIVRVTSDCPLIDPQVVDMVVATFLAVVPTSDYASNTLTRTYPRGLDVEVFSRVALEKAALEDADPATREHVTPYLYRHPDVFRLVDVKNAVDLSAHRWTVDTPEDFELVRRILDVLGGRPFATRDVLELLAKNPEWLALNASVLQKAVPSSR